MLTDKIAIVTGASRGIGRAVALDLAKKGVKVVVNYAGNEEKANETVHAIKALGSEAIAVQADISNTNEVAEMIKITIDTFGKIDILVNNAGITKDNLLMRMKEDEWDAVINTNLKGVFLCTKAVSRHMIRQKSGRIINISSIVGVAGNAGQANYAAAKAGVIGLTKTTAKELASREITVNALAPGFIETDINLELAKNDEWKQSTLKLIPLGRPGTVQDVAHTVTFLASEQAKYITGQILSVDGGMNM
jgi:3-oxoacyl-[acyl-carrier protein] reductase